METTTEELLKVDWQSLPLDEQLQYANKLLDRMELLVNRIFANCKATTALL